jgi:1-deoxy-D-xylulose-5-phosphate synthase
VAVINPRFFKPLDESTHEYFAQAADVVATLEDHVAMGGYGSAVLECLSDANIKTHVVRLAWPDQFIEHASSVDYLREKYGLTVPNLVELIETHAGTVRPKLQNLLTIA